MIKKAFFGILWGLAIWLILTFLMGAIWGMTRSPTALRSSEFPNFVLLLPSLLLGVVLVVKGKSELVKRSLISVVLALASWLVAAMLAVAILWIGNVPHDTATRYVHVINPVLLAITLLASCVLVFGIYTGRRNRETDQSKREHVSPVTLPLDVADSSKRTGGGGDMIASAARERGWWKSSYIILCTIMWLSWIAGTEGELLDNLGYVPWWGWLPAAFYTSFVVFLIGTWYWKNWAINGYPIAIAIFCAFILFVWPRLFAAAPGAVIEFAPGGVLKFGLIGGLFVGLWRRELEVQTMRQFASTLLVGAGYLVWVVFAIWSFFVQLAIVHDVAGFWGMVLGFFLFPITFALAPFYAIIAWGDWYPFAVTYGGGIGGFVLVGLGSVIAPAGLE